MKRTMTLTIMMILLLMPAGNSFAGGGGKGGGDDPPRPAYYSFEDLRSGISREQFYFANSNRPPEALVDLGYTPFYPASAAKRASLKKIVSVDPTKYGVNLYRIMSNWNDSIIINFEWDRFRSEGGMKGDLIFTRGNGKAGDFVKRFSNWTHVAIVYNATDRTVFESTPNTGVKVNNTAPNTPPYTSPGWSGITYFTCKNIKLERPVIISAVDNAVHAYSDLPYFPKVSSALDMILFLQRWSDDNNLESMYCSKLVYNTFKDHVNFDSNNTHVLNSSLQDKAPGAPFFAWLGISPDDIYYSAPLNYDFCYSPNLLQL